MRALRALGYVWSAPWGVCGLLVYAVFKLLGWVELRCCGCNEFLMRGPLANWMTSRGWAAVTIGWFVFYWDLQSFCHEGLRRHEQRHVTQALVLGPLFPVVYLVLLVIYGYADHPLERDATKAEELSAGPVGRATPSD